jgi:hypothetical protein
MSCFEFGMNFWILWLSGTNDSSRNAAVEGGVAFGDGEIQTRKEGIASSFVHEEQHHNVKIRRNCSAFCRL